MSELQDTIDRLQRWATSPDQLTAQVVIDIWETIKAARRVANLDYEAAWEVLSGGFDIPPISAKIMSQVAVDAALGITTEND